MRDQISAQPEKQSNPGPRYRRAKAFLFGLALLLSLVAAGCSQGSYPLDIFYEMHYQQSYKSYEPPRLGGVESAVAWFPGPESTSFNTGAHLYKVNCAMCHGPDAKGSASPDGPGAVLKTMVEKYGYAEKAPSDLTLFPPGFIENVVAFTPQPGQPRFFGADSVMPPFGKLLNPEEIRAIAQYIGTLPK